MNPALEINTLLAEAAEFAVAYSQLGFRELYGVTDGKTVGTHLELAFNTRLATRYTYSAGNAASGIDFPELNVDIKTTSIGKPQSSCPFRSARQKVYGLGYSLLVLVYKKVDVRAKRVGRLQIQHAVYVEQQHTADFQTTTGLLRLLDNNANKDDLIGFFAERSLPLDELGASHLADEVLARPPAVGYLTISPANQWRLAYTRAITLAGTVPGLRRLV